MNRRRFLILAAAAAAGCSRREDKPVAAKPTSRHVDENVIDTGLLGEFKTDGVYDQFREQGFFIIRRDNSLFVLSAICTHKGCKVRAQKDQSFLCKCHGSRFAADGTVVSGPATKPLPRLAIRSDADGRVLVNRNRTVSGGLQS